ncbi:hypothetical protein RyT2_27280 [Pseudolactococcus yaeyamensis]
MQESKLEAPTLKFNLMAPVSITIALLCFIISLEKLPKIDIKSVDFVYGRVLLILLLVCSVSYLFYLYIMTKFIAVYVEGDYLYYHDNYLPFFPKRDLKSVSLKNADYLFLERHDNDVHNESGYDTAAGLKIQFKDKTRINIPVSLVAARDVEAFIAQTLNYKYKLFGWDLKKK